MGQTKSARPPQNLAVGALYVVCTIEGAAVMAVELISAKMIGVYFGNSLYVWAAVLAVTLLGLASGYYAGGVLSARFPSVRTLITVVAISAVLVALMPFLGSLVMAFSLDLSVQTASLISAMLFLFPPLVCFGMVSPLIVNLVSQHNIPAGKAAGTVYAISTVGGIAMTLIVGFYLIPHSGLRTSTMGVALLLGAIPICYLALKRRVVAAVLCFGVLSGLLLAQVQDGRTKDSGQFVVRHISDGLLGQVMVVETIREQTDEVLRILTINNLSQNMVHLPSFRSKWRYVHRIALYSSVKPATSRALICGLGGGNVVNEYERLGFRIDAVEIDPRMEEIARRWFGMTGNVNVYTDDCRHYLNTTSERYDLVVLDMASGDSQPINVYTVESFRTIRDLLTPGGFVFLHYQNQLGGAPSIAARSIGRTLQAAGLSVRMVNTRVDHDRVGEIMFLATKDEAAFASLESSGFERRDRFADPYEFPQGEELFLDYSFEEGHLLTDDWPIMEELHQHTIDSLRGKLFRQQMRELVLDRVEFI